MRILSKLILASLVTMAPLSLVACGDDDEGGNGTSTGGAAGSGGGDTGGGDSGGSGGGDTGGSGGGETGGMGGGETGGTGGGPLEEAPFTAEDCGAADGPNSAVTGSGVGAFTEAADWMEGWTNFSTDSSGVGNDPVEEQLSDVLDGASDETITLDADTVYGLDQIVYVPAGVTLEIPAGTVIKASTGTNASLVIRRGAKIEAIGTADNPIVFTSDSDDGDKARNQWGGLIILGSATNFAGDDVTIEGLAVDAANQHGGDDDDDDSGTLRYVRIEFGGYELVTDEEINGLTLGSVGSGTDISYVQVNTTQDDGIEWFGGTHDAHHLVVSNAGDDLFDADQGFRGNLTNLFGRHSDPLSGDPNGFEMDSDNDGDEPVTEVNIENATVCGTGEVGINISYGMVLRERLTGSIDNAMILGFDAAFDVRDDFGSENDPNITITNSAEWENADGIAEPSEEDDDNGFDEVEWFESHDNLSL